MFANKIIRAKNKLTFRTYMYFKGILLKNRKKAAMKIMNPTIFSQKLTSFFS